MGHVGDVDLQFVVAVCEIADVDGIVEVASGFAVDGDDGEIAVVAAAAQIVLRVVDIRSLSAVEVPALLRSPRAESDAAGEICGS